MKIIIAGAGEVGYHLAKLLSFESHDITLIDNQKSNLHTAENKLDIKTIEGNSASISILKEANLIPSPTLFCGIENIEAVWYKNFFVFILLLGPNILYGSFFLL